MYILISILFNSEGDQYIEEVLAASENIDSLTEWFHKNKSGVLINRIQNQRITLKDECNRMGVNYYSVSSYCEIEETLSVA